jgi:hypothetical protein
MERYSYNPLPHGERRIRMLELMPGSSSTEIQCRILNYTINIERLYGPYKALSYCWGDLRDSRRILVRDPSATQDSYLEVSANLFSALLKLRDSGLLRMIWVDALCINQEDVEERGQQVQIMATMYASASQVIVWLGK